MLPLEEKEQKQQQEQQQSQQLDDDDTMHISQNTTSTSYSTCDTSKNSLNCLNLSDLTAVADGGAATSVYSLLHSDTLSDTTRHALRSALLRYCELDTLAMVMIYEHLNSIS